MQPYYQDDAVTLFHGDCRNVLAAVSGDLVVTDPPYGMGKAECDEALVPVDSWLPIAQSKGPVVLFCGVRGLYDYPRPDWIGAWVRVGSTQRNGKLRGFNNWEPILYYGIDSLPNDTISAPNYHGVEGHPTPKPLRLMAVLLSRLPAGVVIDPFAGSGTTLLAAKNDGRRAIGIELNERYCEIAAQRLTQGVLPLEFSA